MKEITDILKAYQRAEKDGLQSALATVVKVEGSSYRRPGARMLITENGELTGAISGGCLEGDALRKALSAIIKQENKLITYDTTDEDDAKIGVQLGCNGIVHILFEPINADDSLNPISILSALQSERKNAVVVTLFSMKGRKHPGTSLLYREESLRSKLPTAFTDRIIGDATDILKNKISAFRNYHIEGTSIDGFLEYMQPPISLVIAGAGNDAQPLAEIAYLLGWAVTVADGRPSHASAQRFPNAERVLVVKPGQILSNIADEQTAFVLMTHNYNYDLQVLDQLLKTKARYIGTLGPRTKLIRMLDELGLNTEENQLRVHGPVGLDIGAETAEEIAISIVSEIKAVFSGASSKSLKEKTKSIHF